MRKSLRVGLIAILLVVGMGSAAAAVWYKQDRAGMLHSLCEAGLPNFSRPRVVRKDDLGCTILSQKTRVKGVLLTGFEASSLRSKVWGDDPAWHTCNQTTGCDKRVDAMLSRKISGVCVGLAEITTEGWVTVSPGRYGHLGLLKREFFEDRVIQVGPPPQDEVRRWQKAYAEAGITDCLW
jgi:hypothetical protein